MSSEVQICNTALSALGIAHITSLSDNSKAARECNLVYEDKRDELLRSYEWNFATDRTSLAPTSTTPDFEWEYTFNKPSDCLKLLYVGDAYLNPYPYKLENNQILCNYDTIYIRYIKKITDVNTMDVDFRKALAYSIAQQIAPTLGAKSLAGKMVEEFENAISGARFDDSVEADEQETFATTDWLNSRL